MEPKFLHKKSAANLAAWMANPNQIDYYNRSSTWVYEIVESDKIYYIGSQTQNISSWNSIARSFLTFSNIQTNPKKEAQSIVNNADRTIVDPQMDVDHYAGLQPCLLENVNPQRSAVVIGVSKLPVRAFRLRSHGNQQEYEWSKQKGNLKQKILCALQSRSKFQLPTHVLFLNPGMG